MAVDIVANDAFKPKDDNSYNKLNLRNSLQTKSQKLLVKLESEYNLSSILRENDINFTKDKRKFQIKKKAEEYFISLNKEGIGKSKKNILEFDKAQQANSTIEAATLPQKKLDKLPMMNKPMLAKPYKLSKIKKCQFLTKVNEVEHIQKPKLPKYRNFSQKNLCKLSMFGSKAKIIDENSSPLYNSNRCDSDQFSPYSPSSPPSVPNPFKSKS